MSPSHMNAMDEFGLKGFVATARSENPDVSGLARGQDLSALGLNLNSPELVLRNLKGHGNKADSLSQSNISDFCRAFR